VHLIAIGPVAYKGWRRAARCYIFPSARLHAPRVLVGRYEAMPRYYFDTHDGNRLHEDHEGLELRDDEAARVEARKAIGEIAADDIPGEGSRKSMSIQVRKADGTELLQLSIVFTLQLRNGAGNEAPFLDESPRTTGRSGGPGRP
jgi:hypothetical protein